MTSTPNLQPKFDLEAVTRCQVCGCTARSSSHAALTDRVFAIADGTWNSYQCTNYQSAHFAPRPTHASVGRANSEYYVHSHKDHPIVARRGHVHAMPHGLIYGNEYHRYGMRRHPAIAVGWRLLPLMPLLRSAAEAELRHLSTPAFAWQWTVAGRWLRQQRPPCISRAGGVACGGPKISTQAPYRRPVYAGSMYAKAVSRPTRTAKHASTSSR